MTEIARPQIIPVKPTRRQRTRRTKPVAKRGEKTLLAKHFIQGVPAKPKHPVESPQK